MNKSETDFESLSKEILNNPDAKAAYLENRLRHKIAERFHSILPENKKPIEFLCKETKLPRQTIKSILMLDVGGNINLRDLIRVSEVLGSCF